MLTRAIVFDVEKAPRPPAATTPTPTMAAIAMTAAATRQNVSLRLMRRRSTITSESSDIRSLQKWSARNPRVLQSQRHYQLSQIHQLRRNMKKTRPVFGGTHSPDGAKRNPGRSRSDVGTPGLR